MTGMTEAEYRDMMLHGGRSIEGNRIADQVREAHDVAEDGSTPGVHATITGAVFTSHVPAIGAAWTTDKTEEPYWKAVFDGYEFSKQWEKENLPDVIFLVYNDHATAFDLSIIPTFVLGTGASYPAADEGYGPRPVPGIEGDPELAAHIAHSLIRDDFDLTLVNEMTVDHGLTVPLTLMFGDVEQWPCKVIPFHVNVVQYPVPSGQRCFGLGQALRRAVESYDRPVKVQVWGTGGMSHQLQGPRAGLINQEWDNRWLDALIDDPAELSEVAAPRVRRGGRIGGHRARHVVHRPRRPVGHRRQRRGRGQAPLLPRAGLEHRCGTPDPREPAERVGCGEGVT